jgi:FtsP/CotA-like multicopper oxidase with cupredoxin domain
VKAIVTMSAPGVWILAELDEEMRKQGFGVVVEYANRKDEPKWVSPEKQEWDYTIFGAEVACSVDRAGEPHEAAEFVPVVFRPKFAGNNWVDHWTINGKEYPKTDPILVRENHRYRLRFDNRSDDDHPVHLHRHSFEPQEHRGDPEGRGGSAEAEGCGSRGCGQQSWRNTVPLPPTNAHGLRVQALLRYAG